MTASVAHTRRRLAAISHHFLSGPESGAAGKGKPTLVLPLLAAGLAGDFPTALLTRAVLVRGRSVHVLECERALPRIAHPRPSNPSHRDSSVPPADTGGGNGPAFLEGLEAALAALERAPDLCLLPLEPGQWPLAAACGGVLLAVGPGTEGGKGGYLAVKRLHAMGLREGVGVIMAGSPSLADAAADFERLAAAAQRFLGLELVSYGCLPALGGPHAARDLLDPDGPDGPLLRALDGVAALLVAELPGNGSATGVKVKAQTAG
ncbi:MAG: hypothetical protein HZA24_08785 [Nitrospirae bacterium]|nr:hypothetical protein [Nitrospirota bacterium]